MLRILLISVFVLVAFSSSAYAEKLTNVDCTSCQEITAETKIGPLTKSEARIETNVVAHELGRNAGMTSYTVEPASRCKRVSRMAVDCTYTETYETLTVKGTIHVQMSGEGEIHFTLGPIHKIKR